MAPDHVPDHVYVVSEVRPRSISADQLLTLPDTDKQGRVLFRTPMESGKFNETLAACIEATRAAIRQTASLADGYIIDEVKLSLGLDASVGCVFLGEGTLQASIEVTIKRV